MKRFLLIFTISLFYILCVNSQPCTPVGDQTTYGTGNIWIGYTYNSMNFTDYRSYVNEGTAASPNFDRNFGGSNVNYPTTGCFVQTETFSMRYKLTKTFTSGNYIFTVGGDDGYRLSLDGGATWAIDRWNDQSYTITTLSVALNGTYNMVLEYYENGGENRISFALSAACNGTENTGIYGTGNIWNGYVYDGTNFEVYAGMVHEGSASDPAFDQNFGGANVSYATSGCPVQTETFSLRYRLSKTFAAGTYMFTVGADDGYRLSVDGGATWIINNWTLHSYTTTSYSASLSGTHDLVLEYYENAVDNRVSFAMQTLSILPVTLESFTAREKEHTVQLNWNISSNSDPRLFEVEKSINGLSFSGIGTVPSNSNSVTQYSFTDQSPFRGMAYYRLKMTDRSGITTYSATVSIRAAVTSANKISVYPTVVTGNSFFVTSSSNIRNAVITITGLNGKILSKQNAGNITTGQAIRVFTGAATSGKGIYAVTISGSDFGITTGKIIIQ
ncbi:PA14 domain-containing protein [Agriterribacter sp.]|uniref:PA14 domain-containing protein n=1 Tax=Agriterribacter sp. TaxID=2821509 RepID=UPI002D15B23F|nr:PA14 domain-containing protein [Agriterribacter sp.]HTN07195.1 PA14 domain-containing protein [Agriterribacter sp.]